VSITVIEVGRHDLPPSVLWDLSLADERTAIALKLAPLAQLRSDVVIRAMALTWTATMMGSAANEWWRGMTWASIFAPLLVAAAVAPLPYDAWFPGTSSIDEMEIIPPAYRGIWAPSAAACKDQDGVDLIAVKPKGVDFYEAGARLERVTQAGQDRTIKLKLSYEGEGEFWDRVEVLALNEDGSKLTIQREGEASPVRSIKCER
jgi:hypothetical protein